MYVDLDRKKEKLFTPKTLILLYKYGIFGSLVKIFGKYIRS